MKEMIKDSTLILLLISAVYLSVMGITQVRNAHDKQTTDWTGTHQGVHDSLYWQREEDSINAYMRHWYEVLDTNSDGEIDDTVIEWLEE